MIRFDIPIENLYLLNIFLYLVLLSILSLSPAAKKLIGIIFSVLGVLGFLIFEVSNYYVLLLYVMIVGKIYQLS